MKLKKGCVDKLCKSPKSKEPMQNVTCTKIASGNSEASIEMIIASRAGNKNLPKKSLINQKLLIGGFYCFFNTIALHALSK